VYAAELLDERRKIVDAPEVRNPAIRGGVVLGHLSGNKHIDARKEVKARMIKRKTNKEIGQ
jgi:hypothetical protein